METFFDVVSCVMCCSNKLCIATFDEFELLFLSYCFSMTEVMQLQGFSALCEFASSFFESSEILNRIQQLSASCALQAGCGFAKELSQK